MDSDEETPMKRKYPQRIRKKVDYGEFETSIGSIKKPPKKSKLDNSSDLTYNEDSETGEDEEKENESKIESEDDNEEISEYEKLRLKNVEENRRIMIELGLIDPNKEQQKKNEKVLYKPKTSRTRKKTPIQKKIEPTKRSLRLLRKTPEGKDIPFDIYQGTPIDSPTLKEEDYKTRIDEEILPMSEEGGENVDFLDSLKASLSQESAVSSQESTDSLIDDMRNLRFGVMGRVTSTRIQSMCVHPMDNQLLVLAGSMRGELGLWNLKEDKVAKFTPHIRNINCISVSPSDQSKLFTTSFDGTVRRGDLNKSVFELVYQTGSKSSFCHITWHTNIDENNLLVAHGTGEAVVVDLRAKNGQRWFHCHPRSIRTIQLHPTQPHYFLTASGTGECKIWDMRGSQKHVDVHVGDLSLSKALTSAFFSPDGNKVVATCNDDFLHIYDTSDLANPKELHRTMHDNHTGQWLSVFKAVWHTHSSDLFFVGSMLQPRRIQLYNGSGRLMRELKDTDNLTTVVPVISLHPSLPIVVGGNSTGKAHLFTTPQFLKQYDINPE